MKKFNLNNVIKSSLENEKLFSTTIELCTICNWKCNYCYLPEHNCLGLDFNTITNILMQLRKLGVYDLAFTGGEIFLRNDCLKIIELARKLGFSVNLMTNISLLNKDIIDKLEELHIESIACSLFSMDEKKHNDFINKNDYKKIMENLDLLSKTNIFTIVKVMITNFNYKEINKFIEFCEIRGLALKFDYRIFPKLNHDHSSCKYNLKNEELSQIILELDRFNGVEYIDKCSDLYVCESTRNSIFIDAQGNVKICNMINISLGNVNSDSIENILKDSKVVNFIRNHKWKDLKKECINCKLNKYCTRCPGVNLLWKDDFLGKNSQNCKIAEVRKIALEEEEQNGKK